MTAGIAIAGWLALAWGQTIDGFGGIGLDGHGPVVGDLGTALAAPAFVPWAASDRAGASWIGGALDYSDRTWVDGTGRVRLDDLYTTVLAGGWTPHERFRLTASAPLHLASRDVRGREQGVAPGDLRLGLHPVLWTGGAVDLGVVGLAGLPTGDPTRSLGWRGFTGDLLGSATVRAERLRLTATVGPSLRPNTTTAGAPSTALLVGAAGAFEATEELALGAELLIARPVEPDALAWLGTAVEGLATARIAMSREVRTTFAVGHGPTRAVGAPGARLLLGVAWVPQPPAPAPQPVVDAAQVVEVTPEDALVWLPHPICQWLPHREARGRLAELPPGTEIHLRAPGHLPQQVAAHGGSVALEVAPPQGGMVVLAEPWDRVEVDGEALPRDEDGAWLLALSEGSHTVSVFGAGRNWQTEAATVEGYAVWLRAPGADPVGVLFAAGSSRLRPEAVETLERLAANLGDYAYEIRGAFSPEGQLERNRALAEARARAVADWLIARGLAPERVTVIGSARPPEGYAVEAQRRVDVIPVGEGS